MGGFNESAEEVKWEGPYKIASQMVGEFDASFRERKEVAEVTDIITTDLRTGRMFWVTRIEPNGDIYGTYIKEPE